MNQQSFKINHLKLIIQSISTTPLLQAIPSTTIQNIRQSFKSSLLQKYFLQEISYFITSQNSVVVRLKYWALVHLLISSTITHETENAIEFIIEQNFQKTTIETDRTNVSQLDRYFITQIEMPYLSLLKKLIIWKKFEFSSYQTDAISLGFSQLNKIKEILQMKRIFHYYNCYYSQHLYVFNIFESFLINIKRIWTAVCIKIKNITLNALKSKNIQVKEYMLIKESQLVQDLLIQFVYGESLVIKLPKELRIKSVNLLKPEIQNLYQQINSKRAIQAIVDELKSKKIRKNSENSQKGYQETKESERYEDRLNTQQKIQIINSINEIQKMLSFNI